MRLFVLSIFFSIACLTAYSQSWEILNTNLKAEKKGEKLLLSYLDERESILLSADTVMLDENNQNLFFLFEGHIGVLDPLRLEVLQEATFLSIRNIHKKYYLVETEEGFYLSACEFPIQPLSGKFESIEVLGDQNRGSVQDYFLVGRKGKFGILSSGISASSFLLQPDYEEINYEETPDGGALFFVRKGDKWGVGMCEGPEVPLKYDEIQYISGSCGDAHFIVKKKGLYGVLLSGNKSPLVSCFYSSIPLLKRREGTFLFLFRNEQLEFFCSSEEIMNPGAHAEPIMLLTMDSGGRHLLVYRQFGEVNTMELSMEEIQRTGLVLLDWLHID